MSKLYVGNLSWDTTEETLRQAFSQDGRKVNNVSIITDRDTGRPRGFAFVEMGSKDDANNAILGSNPTEPLPPEYPEPRAFFTVTFYYNENPN